MNKPFRWDVTKREQLGRLLEGPVAGSYVGFSPKLLRCCARVLSFCDDSDLIFVGRSPESIFDLLSGLLADSSWAKRLNLFVISVLSLPEPKDAHFAEQMSAIREQMAALGLTPAQLAHRQRPLALVDLVAGGHTFGNITHMLLQWAREVGADERLVRRNLRFVGITSRKKTDPDTWRWQQHVSWAREFRTRAIKNVSIPFDLWAYLIDDQPKVAKSNPPWRWDSEDALQPPREPEHLEALRMALQLYELGATAGLRRHFAALLSGEPGMRERWFRALVLELRGVARLPTRAQAHKPQRPTLEQVASSFDQPPSIALPVKFLRWDVGDDSVLTDTALGRIIELQRACRQSPRLLRQIRDEAPEYGQTEFLLNVDPEGAPVHLSVTALSGWRQAEERDVDPSTWLQEARLPGEDKPVWLVARWLAHWVGLRHRTVHLFMDHPTLDGHTYVQLRGFGKAEATGTFDLPVAGHVSGLEAPEEALWHELQEELHLGPQDVEELQALGSYDDSALHWKLDRRNVENRLIYRCRLRAASMGKIESVAPEVAAICTFPIGELQELVSKHGARVAPGLKEALPVYLKALGIPVPEEPPSKPRKRRYSKRLARRAKRLW